MIPFKNADGKDDVMSREEFFSCGYVSPREAAPVMYQRMTVVDLAAVWMVQKEDISRILNSAGIKPGLHVFRKYKPITPHEMEVVMNARYKHEAIRQLRCGDHRMRLLTKQLGKKWQGERWQAWETDLIHQELTPIEIARKTRRSLGAVVDKMKRMRRGW